MGDDANVQLAEEAIELAESMGEAYIEEVAHLINVNDLETLRVFHRAMQLTVNEVGAINE